MSEHLVWVCACPGCQGGGPPDHFLAETIADPGVTSAAALSPTDVATQLRTQWGGYFEGRLITWNKPVVTFSVNDGAAGWPTIPAEVSGLVGMTALMQSRASLAFQLWDDLIPLTLQETNSASADVTFNMSSATSNATYSASGALTVLNSTTHAFAHPQVWLASQWASHNSDAAMGFGGYGFTTYLHEIGHVLGLSHPGTYNAAPGVNVTYANAAEYQQDTRRYSIMSYFSANADGSGTDHVGSAGVTVFAQTPMLHDILAIQAAYGASADTRTGNTTYGFNNSSGRAVFDFSVNTNPIVTIFDSGGVDTIDLSGFTRSNRLDLTPGAYSDIGGFMTNNLAIAYGTVIENVVGGSGDDTLLGSDRDDTFDGHDGNDFIDGRGGLDTITFSGATSPPPRGVSVNLTAGTATDPYLRTDTLRSIENAHGTGLADILTGVSVDGVRTMLRGLAGNDVLRAPVVDTLITADYRGDPGAVTVNLGTGIATDGWAGTDVLDKIQSVIGSRFNDSITGGARNDLLDGGAGNDRLFGGDGNDTFIDGSGNDLHDGGAGFDIVDLTGSGRRGGSFSYLGGDLLLTRGAEVDTYRNVERLNFVDGTLWTDVDSTAAKIVRLYQAAFDRTADQGGLNFWIDALGTGARLDDLSAGFVGSQEFISRFGAGLSNGGFVNQLYLNVLEREADGGGWAFWSGALAAGTLSRAAVLTEFSESAENKTGTDAIVRAGIWDVNENAAKVARMYDTALGRLPDVAGLSFWTTSFEAGSQTLDTLAAAFTGSAEFQSVYGALSNRAFVELAYLNTLDRAGESGGVDFWTDWLNAGNSRSAMVVQFSESAEHVVLTGPSISHSDPAHFGILFA